MTSRTICAARFWTPRARLPHYLNRDVYEPWVQSFCSDTGISGLPRNHLYQRVVMLLALDLTLKNGSH